MQLIQFWSGLVRGQTRTSLIFGIRIIIFEELDLELDLQFRLCAELELGLEDLHKTKEPCSTEKNLIHTKISQNFSVLKKLQGCKNSPQKNTDPEHELESHSRQGHMCTISSFFLLCSSGLQR